MSHFPFLLPNRERITANTITVEIIAGIRQCNACEEKRSVWEATFKAEKLVAARPVVGFRRVPSSVAVCVEVYNAALPMPLDPSERCTFPSCDNIRVRGAWRCNEHWHVAVKMYRQEREDQDP